MSLALALISTEFSLGPLSKAVRFTLGVLSGIPSIVYALASVVFISSFMIPKFAASASGPYELPQQFINTPQGSMALPWGSSVDPNSTLLGGFLIALLVIPFLAPMVEDALRSVPAAQREASLALGTTRWHTMRRIILPYSSPGLVSAISLGTLKALGDVMIAIFVIGFEAPSLPVPIIDAFQRTPPLTAVGANLLGGLAGNGSCRSLIQSTVVGSLRNGQNRCDAAYFSAFLLMLIAFVVLIAAFYLQSRFRKRYAR
jgi:phosphate transport system permease protein